MKYILTALLFLLSYYSKSQEKETQLTKSIISADIGFLGIWVNYERHLGGLFTLKSGIGFEGGFGISSSLDVDNYFILIPTLRAEPRYYYNFSRRVQKEKKTSFNAANYIAVSATYISNLFTISNVSYLDVLSGISIVPKIGIQRTIGRRANFQFAIGAGPFFSEQKTMIIPGVDLRFGYNIK